MGLGVEVSNCGETEGTRVVTCTPVVPCDVAAPSARATWQLPELGAETAVGERESEARYKFI
jgi:hypothetical protein